MIAKQQNLTFISSVWTLYVVEMIYQEWWLIEKESRESIMSAYFGDDDDDDESIQNKNTKIFL